MTAETTRPDWWEDFTNSPEYIAYQVRKENAWKRIRVANDCRVPCDGNDCLCRDQFEEQVRKGLPGD